MNDQYLAYVYVRYQDCHEEPILLGSKEECLKFLSRYTDGANKGYMLDDMRLFKIGEEVPIEIVKEEEPQPAKVKSFVKLKG